MTGLDEGEWHRACAAADLPQGERIEAQMPDGTLVLVLRTADGLFACCADCPHQDTPLIEGEVDGTVLTCTLHYWQWDLRDGKPIGAAELPLPLYAVRERDGVVEISKAR